MPLHFIISTKYDVHSTCTASLYLIDDHVACMFKVILVAGNNRGLSD